MVRHLHKSFGQTNNRTKLTVRSAVKEILDGDLSISDAQKNSPGTQRILSQIKNDSVTGDPAERTTTLPSALAFIVDHATRQSPKSFTEL